MVNKKDEKESKISDTVKKIISVGVGAAFMTEDAVKGVLHDLPLSKDILSGVMQNAKSTKEDFIHSVKDEVHSYLKNLDPKVLIDGVLERYDVEVQATFKFRKKELLESNNNVKKEVKRGSSKKTSA